MSGTDRITSYDHDGLTFDVTDTGPLDGEVVVLLHGFPQMASSWDRLSPLLHDHGYRTIAPDQRGYSPRARPTGRGAYRLPLLVGDVVALLERIGEPVHLVGHDWGAAIGWTVAAQRADLLRTWTSVSVPHPTAFLRSMTQSPQLLKSWYMIFFQLPAIPELVLRRFPGVLHRALAATGMDRALRARVVEEMIEGGALTGGINYYRGLPLSSPWTLGQKVRVPTTHVWSPGDVALVRRGADLAKDFVDAPYRLEVLEDATHWIPDQDAPELAAIIVRRARG